MVALVSSKLRSKDNEIAFIERRVDVSYPDYSEVRSLLMTEPKA